MGKKIFLKIFLLVLTVAVMCFIFKMSAMEAEESAELSTSVGYTVGEIVVEGFDEMPQAEQAEYVDSIEHPLRKLAHFSEFAALGFLLVLDVAAFTAAKGLKRYVIAVILGLVYAATDERHQIMVSGRSCELRDLLIDTGGVVVGCAVASLIIALLVFFKGRKKKS